MGLNDKDAALIIFLVAIPLTISIASGITLFFLRLWHKRLEVKIEKLITACVTKRDYEIRSEKIKIAHVVKFYRDWFEVICLTFSVVTTILIAFAFFGFIFSHQP